MHMPTILGPAVFVGPQMLTKRQIIVISELARSKNNKQIAQELHLSEKTIQQHAMNAVRRLGITKVNLALLTHWAILKGLVSV